MRFLSRISGMVCRDVGEGGGAGVLDQEQLDMIGDMLDGPKEFIDPEIDQQEPSATPEPNKEVETPAPDGEALEPVAGQEPAEATQEDQTQSTIESLRNQILALTEMVGLDPLKQAVQPNVTAQDPATPVQTAQATLENFLSPEELDRLIDEPQLINVAFQRFQSATAASMGSYVQQEVSKQLMINRVVTDFYQANEDLKPYANFVKFVMAEVEGANKDKPYTEIFQTTATECRKRLGLANTAVSGQSREPNKAAQKPAFVGNKRGNARPSAGDGEFFDPNAAEMFNLRD